ncbi:MULTISPECIES: hypothetical protein [Paraburkholderia]|nr:hypothetical protein [Paraburkholderia podalyriae]
MAKSEIHLSRTAEAPSILDFILIAMAWPVVSQIHALLGRDEARVKAS